MRRLQTMQSSDGSSPASPIELARTSPSVEAPLNMMKRISHESMSFCGMQSQRTAGQTDAVNLAVVRKSSHCPSKRCFRRSGLLSLRRCGSFGPPLESRCFRLPCCSRAQTWVPPVSIHTHNVHPRGAAPAWFCESSSAEGWDTEFGRWKRALEFGQVDI